MKFSVVVALVGALFVGTSAVGLSRAMAKDPNGTVCGQYNPPAASCPRIDCQSAGGEGGGTCADENEDQYPYNAISQIENLIGSCLIQPGSNCDATKPVPACITYYYNLTAQNTTCDTDTASGCENGIATQVGCS